MEYKMSQLEKIAVALERVKSVATKHIVKGADINRADRELLLRTRWLQEIIKGWYMLVRPDVSPKDSGSWYANFWDYLSVYLNERFGDAYCLSAENSLELLVAANVMPQQVVVIVTEGGVVQQLPFNTSILTYADPNKIPQERITIDDLQVMPLAFALCKTTPSYFLRNAENAEIALRSIRAPSELSQVILEHNFKRAAERIIGAYQHLGMNEQAEKIVNDLATAGMKVTPINPFKQQVVFLQDKQFRSPYGARIAILWHKYREEIIQHFPDAPGLPKKSDTYLNQVNDLYEYDAYNSLSIEGYEVSEKLIAKVKANQWNPDLTSEDTETRNALAARGYYEAFQLVKEVLADIIVGAPPGECIDKHAGQWYQALFAPAVRANIIKPTDLIGYRNDRVFIRHSRHSPPPKEAVLDAMESFFHCLKNEEDAAVRAVLGHYVFVFIHPYMDGNGRVARFILNTMLASGGYPWTVVEVKRRATYINALETAHTEGDIKPFIKFIVKEMQLSSAYLDTH